MKKIFIRAGHGGKDSGAIGNGLVEKDINLKVAKYLKGYLSSQKELDIKMLREDDTFYTLSSGVGASNKWGADLFISIHHNGGGGSGYEVYHSMHSNNGRRLAECISMEFRATGQIPHGVPVKIRESTAYRGHDYYTELGQTNAIAVITEYAFLDSKDSKSVDTEQELRNEAKAIAKAICKYLQLDFIEKEDEFTMKERILEIQRLLNKLGYTDYEDKKLVEDGIMGARTKAAIDKLNNYLMNLGR